MNRDQFIKVLFERAREAGFEACEVYQSLGSSFECEVFKGEIVSYSASDAMGLSFRGLIGGKMGYASTQALDEAAIDLLIESAARNARMIENEDRQFIYEGGGEYARVDAYAPALEDVTAAQKLSMCRSLEEKAIAASDKIDQVEGCEVFSETGEVLIENTKGLKLCHRSNLIGAYVAPLAKDGEKVNSTFKFVFTQDLGDVDLDKLAGEAAKECVDGLYAKSCASGEMPLAIRGDAMASMLSTFSGVFSAEEAQKGLSLLKDREGEAIAAPCVSILDDPHMARMAASAPFDAEGVPTRVKRVVDGGKLTTLLHNLKTAAKQGIASTGNAAKASYAASVGIAPSNFYLEPSKTPLSELLAQLGSGLLITDVQGLHAGANAVSGDFSLAAKGYFVENGKLTGAAKGITVAGNFFQLLERIQLAADDLTFSPPGGMGCFGSPTVLVSALSVAGEA